MLLKGTMTTQAALLLLLLTTTLLNVGQCQALPNLILLDNTMGLGRNFDGIGGISGGSVTGPFLKKKWEIKPEYREKTLEHGTSKLLPDYKDPERSQILDYLFKPHFGASLQMLKVEIGGDAPSSAATEASHMHNSTDENYHRGYEWWLMKEAKSRNPDIKLYGLPWSFPGWLGNGFLNPYLDLNRLATYVMKWVKGARDVHGLHIDYIGIWNEKPYRSDYIKVLRKTLDDNGLNKTRIVATDNFGWDFVNDLTRDPQLQSAVDIVGVHYPGTESTQLAVQLGKPLWSSEDYSTYNDPAGGGCWARILNQNYVNGYMTSTIAWNLVDSWFQDLPDAYERDSLMTANQPWSGHYVVDTPIWASAHTTQFTAPGWSYLRHGYGVGLLEKGGSIVSFVSPDAAHLTVVIETMSHDHSKCIRPALPAYNVSTQNITLQLMGSFVDIQELQVWYSKMDPTGHGSATFVQLPPLKVSRGQVHFTLGVDEIYTLTTVTDGQRGDYGTPPPSAPFPIEYFAFFGLLNDSSEAPYFSAQQGVFEVVTLNRYSQHLRQTVLQPPIPWCSGVPLFNGTLSLLGSFQWSEVQLRSEVLMIPVNGSGGVFIAARIDKGGCNTYKARGLFFFLFPYNQLFLLTKDIAGNEIIKGGRNEIAIDKVDNTMELLIYKGYVSGKVNRMPVFNVSIPEDVPSHGFVGLGTDSFGYADWDFFGIRNASNPIAIADDVLRFSSENF